MDKASFSNPLQTLNPETLNPKRLGFTVPGRACRSQAARSVSLLLWTTRIPSATLKRLNPETLSPVSGRACRSQAKRSVSLLRWTRFLSAALNPEALYPLNDLVLLCRAGVCLQEPAKKLQPPAVEKASSRNLEPNSPEPQTSLVLLCCTGFCQQATAKKKRELAAVDKTSFCSPKPRSPIIPKRLGFTVPGRCLPARASKEASASCGGQGFFLRA